MKSFVSRLMFVLVFAIGCNNADLAKVSNTENTVFPKNTTVPVFILDWSEYPSWSVFGVAHERGILNGKEGEQSDLEKKWNVDVVLKQSDYDTCLTHFGSNTVDAACLTNLDTLAPSLGRLSVAILPTSTSVGADACITVGIDDIDSLKGVPVYGLEKV
jgi:hypothetical protein